MAAEYAMNLHLNIVDKVKFSGVGKRFGKGSSHFVHSFTLSCVASLYTQSI